MQEMFQYEKTKTVSRYLYCIFFFFLFFSFCQHNRLSAQTIPDSVAAVDTSKKNLIPPIVTADTSRKIVTPVSPDTSKQVSLPANTVIDTAKKNILHEKAHSVIEMEFVKDKSEQATDSIFFNVLKIFNNNGKPVQGAVKISVPEGWKIISKEETIIFS